MTSKSRTSNMTRSADYLTTRNTGLSREMRPGFVPYAVSQRRTKSATFTPVREHEVPLVPPSAPAHHPPPVDHGTDIVRITNAFVALLLNTQESLDVLIRLWVEPPRDPRISHCDRIYEVIRNIALAPLDLRVELNAPDLCESGQSRLGGGDAITGYVSIFPNPVLSIPLSMMTQECLACLGAMCTRASDCFASKAESKLQGRIVYSGFRYNSLIGHPHFERTKIVNRIVDSLLIQATLDHFYHAKNMLAVAFGRFRGEETAAVRESHKRLLYSNLRQNLVAARRSSLPDNTSLAVQRHVFVMEIDYGVIPERSMTIPN